MKLFTVTSLEEGYSGHVIARGIKREVERRFSDDHPVRKLIRKADRSGGFSHATYNRDGERFHVVVSVKKIADRP